MNAKWHTLQRITESGLVIVVRADHADDAKRITEACLKGGAISIEITYTTPGASQIIEQLRQEFADALIVGAGTVLDSETARIAILSGAQYVVSPYLDESTMTLCNRYQVPCMPGAMTIEQVVRAMELGADIIKLFPGEAFGPKMIKAIKGPLPQANLMPTGGVSEDNLEAWISAGAVAVGTGGSLTASAKHGDYESIVRKTENMLNLIRQTRQQLASLSTS